MKRFAVVAPLLLLPLLLQGCLLIAGAAIALGVVHVASEDTTEVNLEGTRDHIYDACEAEMKARGVVEKGDRVGGTLEGRVGGSSVTVTVEKATESAWKVAVRARKNSGISPDLDTAQQVAYAIVKRVGG